MKLLLADQPFQNFWQLTTWLFENTQQTHKIALNRLFDYVYRVLQERNDVDIKLAKQALFIDYKACKMKGVPDFLRDQIPNADSRPKRKQGNRQRRQAQHKA